MLELMTCIQKLIQILRIAECGRLELLPLYRFTSLEFVRVYLCENLKYMEASHDTNLHLRSIYIYGCPAFSFSLVPFEKQPWQLTVVQSEINDVGHETSSTSSDDISSSTSGC